jgi:pimeloyl-[acyl-carrier protein] methyl ester esterase
MRLVFLPGIDGRGLLFADFVAALAREVEPTIVAYPPDRALGYAELEGMVRASL